ncbi:unnamed protein product [Microthlaspi erraticum]|uniref:Aldehyde dehydrogenase domain-containing protein n=1 Tax=Microthlaspi erraticum TaxID=1685480 RepID=A0A6D2KZX3_9BRAS|nr:unnamed protein product [Microthlaspi erraticum]
MNDPPLKNVTAREALDFSMKDPPLKIVAARQADAPKWISNLCRLKPSLGGATGAPIWTVHPLSPSTNLGRREIQVTDPPLRVGFSAAMTSLMFSLVKNSLTAPVSTLTSAVSVPTVSEIIFLEEMLRLPFHTSMDILSSGTTPLSTLRHPDQTAAEVAVDTLYNRSPLRCHDIAAKQAVSFMEKHTDYYSAARYAEVSRAYTQNMDKLAMNITTEQRKTLKDAHGDIFCGLEVVEHACGMATLQMGEYVPNVSNGVNTYSVREPFCVCAAICPFNFPVMSPLWMFPAAVTCGNTFILKPSEKDPVLAFTSASVMLAELAMEAGLPDGVLSIVHGNNDTVNAICDHEDVRAVSFVGSNTFSDSLGFCVKLGVQKKALVDHSSFFAKKLAAKDSVFACLEIESCEDAEIYVETIGLMYYKEMNQRLMKQNVSRVLRVLKVLGFSSCIQSYLDYLEAVPWVGEEEEEKVISSILRLKTEGVIGVVTTTPVLKRIAFSAADPPKETLSRIIELVLRSKEEKKTDTKLIAVEADNLTSLLDVLAERQAAEEFSVTKGAFFATREASFDVALPYKPCNVSALRRDRKRRVVAFERHSAFAVEHVVATVV